MAKRQGRFTQRRSIFVGLFGDLGCTIVSDVRIERRHGHQGLVQMFLNHREIGLNPHGAMIVEGATGIRDKLYGFEQIVDHHRLKDVELKVPLRARKRHCSILNSDRG